MSSDPNMLWAQVPATPQARRLRILAAAGSSPESIVAVDTAAELARALSADLVIVHVFERDRQMHGVGDFGSIKDAEAFVEKLIRRLHGTELDAIGEVHTCGRGLTARIIAKIAGTKAIDLVVVANTQRQGLRKIFSGGVAERLLEISPCPVLCVTRPRTPGARTATAVASDDGPRKAGQP